MSELRDTPTSLSSKWVSSVSGRAPFALREESGRRTAPPPRLVRAMVVLFAVAMVPGCAELTQLRMQTVQQEQDIQALQKERDQYKKAYYDVVGIREKESKDAGSARERLVQEKEDIQAKLTLQKDQAETDRQKLQSELAQEKAERQKTEKDLNDLVASLKAELAKAHEDATVLQNNANTLTTRAETAEKSLADTTAERDQTRKDLEAAKLQVSNAQQKTAELDIKLAEVNAALEEQKKAVEERDKTIAGQKAEVEKLNQELVRVRTEALKAPTPPTPAAGAAASSAASSAPAAAAAVAAVAAPPARPAGLVPDKAKAIAEELTKALADAGIPKTEYAVSEERGGVVARLSSDWLFQEQSVLLSEAAPKALAPLAVALKTRDDVRIRVEGHTDSLPVRNMPFPDNWGLASARADAVVRWLESDGKIPGKQLTAVGRSRFDALADNNTPEGRKKNRRVELVILPLGE